MIKAVLFALWSCLVAVSAAYFGLTWSGDNTLASKAAAKSPKLSHVKMKPISVPMTADGQIKGYVVAQLGYVARTDELKKIDIKPEVFLFDAVFNAIFTRKQLDIGVVDEKGLAEFARHVKEKVNARLGAEVIQDVVAEELGYVPFQQSRGRGGASPAGRPNPTPVSGSPIATPEVQPQQRR